MPYFNPNKPLIDHEVRIKYTGILSIIDYKTLIVSIDEPTIDGLKFHKTTEIEELINKLKHELVTWIINSYDSFIVDEDVFNQGNQNYFLDRFSKLMNYQEKIDFVTSETPDGDQLINSISILRFGDYEEYSKEKRNAIHNILSIVENLWYLELEARQQEATKDTRS